MSKKTTKTTATKTRILNALGDKRIKLLVKENPKRGESEKRFKLYRNGMTVADYVKKGGKTADIRYDISHKFIKLAA